VIATATRDRARASLGQSDDAIYGRAVEVLRQMGAAGVIADIGCGRGRLKTALGSIAADYIGVDAVRYPEFPSDVPFYEADLDREPLPFPDRSVDAAVALETIEHLENPRRFVRELARITRSGGVVLVSTPNQLSGLSLLALLARQRFAAFQDRDYPAHLTALLPIDLQRIGAECGLRSPRIAYSERGRILLTPWHYPRPVSRLVPRLLSDNVFLAGRVS
jgi:SAM-dependent methyltransferase